MVKIDYPGLRLDCACSTEWACLFLHAHLTTPPPVVDKREINMEFQTCVFLTVVTASLVSKLIIR